MDRERPCPRRALKAARAAAAYLALVLVAVGCGDAPVAGPGSDAAGWPEFQGSDAGIEPGDGAPTDAPADAPGDATPADQPSGDGVLPDVGRGGPDGAADAADAAPDTDTAPPPPLCARNADGQIDAAEMPVQWNADIRVLYSVNRPETEAPVPAVDGSWRDGVRHWQFDDYDDRRDQVLEDQIQPLAGFWFAAEFPNADYVGAIDNTGEVLGVYRYDAASPGIALDGLASVTPGETLLRYTTPVLLVRFPVRQGDSYESLEVAAEGTYDGVEYPLGGLTLEHDYRFTVDQSGVAHVPAGDFPALRIATQVEMRALNFGVPLSTSRARIYEYLAECTGLVARIRSLPDEPQPVFTRASEYRRLGFPLD